MLSPAYERLESGTGTGPGAARSKNGRAGRADGAWRMRWAWRRVALGVVVVGGLLWVGSGWGGKGAGWSGPVAPASDAAYDVVPDQATQPHWDDTRPPSKPQPLNPSAPRPTSYETDPDPSATVFCSTPHAPSTRLVQYALMIDAGSTGSRIHVYKFNNCGPSPSYEYETFAQRKPGLSAYKGRPADAAASLDELLDVALRTVPKALHACTPVAVKATAGLRLLGAAESAEILAAVRQHLTDAFPFPVAPGADAVAIMDGRDEGVYAWITANYLLDTIRGGDSPASSSAEPYAVLDLGGASTQIVFEPRFAAPGDSMHDGDHKYELDFAGRTHVLYQHSYLGFGLMRARAAVHRLVAFMNSVRVRPDDASGGVGNPCIARGMRRTVEVEMPGGEKSNVTMLGADVGAFEACSRVVQLVMAKDAVCELKPCGFDGVYQPSLLDTFPRGNILLLSYFYDRLAPLLPTLAPSPSSASAPLPISRIADLARAVCAGREGWTTLLKPSPGVEAMEELEGRPEYCLDLTFMHALLRLGYEFGEERAVRVGKQIDGTELGWALGAAITMVGGELRCKA